jgi:hypothetical protein
MDTQKKLAKQRNEIARLEERVASLQLQKAQILIEKGVLERQLKQLRGDNYD